MTKILPNQEVTEGLTIFERKSKKAQLAKAEAEKKWHILDIEASCLIV